MVEMSRNVQKYFEEIQLGASGHLYFVNKNGRRSSVIKPQQYDEFEGYKLLKEHLACVAVRRIRFQNNPSYLMPYIEGRTLQDMVNDDQQESVAVFDSFFSDLRNLWSRSRANYERRSLRRDYRQQVCDATQKITIDALTSIHRFVPIRESTVIYVNGDNVGSLLGYKKLQLTTMSLEPNSMVLSHGDENFGNILSPNSCKSSKYRVIDLGLAGYYDFAWVLANLYARPFFYNTEYSSLDKLKITGDEKMIEVEGLDSVRTTTCNKIIQMVRNEIERVCIDDEILRMRVCAYAVNNIGRSVAYLRQPFFSETCNLFGLQHFFASLVELRRLLTKL